MGFEYQVRSIVNQIRPDRQTLLFSATFHKRVEAMARDILTKPVRIVVGVRGGASESVKQVVDVLPNDQAKFGWLVQHLANFLTVGRVLIFVGQRQASEELARSLTLQNFKARAIHGEVAQHERMVILNDFKTSKFGTL